MDSKGRALDNIFVERFWRNIKYEEVYLKDYESLREARINIRVYFASEKYTILQSKVQNLASFILS
jgi:hypothetical protein